MNLFQKIVELKKQTEGFYKDTKSFSYTYVSGSQILDKITPVMNELGLLFLPKSATHRNWEQHDYKNAKGQEKTDFIVDGDLVYCWVNAEKPDEVWEIPFQYYGAQDDISKAFGSALTYSERYLLLKSLGLPTDEDDPDSRNTSEKTYNKPEPKKPTQTQSKQTTPTAEPKEPTKTVDEMVHENKTKYYRTIVATLVSNINADELDNQQKGELAKRVLQNYITKELKLSFDKIEFVSKEGQKLIPTNTELVVSEVIDICAKKIEAELAIINTTQEEVI